MALDRTASPHAVEPEPRPVLETPTPRARARQRVARGLGVAAVGLLVGAGPLAGLLAQRIAAAHAEPPLLVALAATVAWELLALLVVVLARAWHTQALDRQASIVRRVLRALAEGVVVADGAGRIALANDAAARFLGPPPPDALACRWIERSGAHPVGDTPCDAAHNPVLRALAGQPVVEEDWTVDAGGASRALAVSARALVDPTGATPGAVLVVRDVSARRRALAETQRLARAVEQTADAVVITDRAGTILYVNPGFEAITGWRREEAVGKTPRILSSGAHRRDEYERLWTTVLRGDVYRATLTNRRRDGTTYPSEQTITPMRDPSGLISHLVSVSKDMTEHRRVLANEVEMRLVAEVARRLVPHDPPTMRGLDVAGASFPSAVACGDYYDIVARPRGGLALVVADVAGHGIGPALLMAATRAYVRAGAAEAVAPGTLLTRIDAALTPDLPAGAFVTAIFVDVDPAGRALSWANAGQIAGLVLGRDGTCRATIGRTGRPLGLTDGEAIRTADGASLADGDVLLLVTDGVTDSLGTEDAPCEPDDLAAIARPLLDRTAAEIVDGIHARVLATPEGAARRDDVTIVVAKATPC